MNKSQLLAACALCLASSLIANPASADTDLKFVKGSDWAGSSDVQREAYLYGVGNLLELEQAMQGANEADSASVVPVLIKGLSGMSLDQVKDALTAWYEQHPDSSDRVVLDVLYTEIALPNN